jgi:copper chaperone CopZ
MREIIKKRTIHVTGMTCEGCEATIDTALSEIDGIKAVKSDKSGRVYVAYNLRKINLEAIEELISGLNFEITNGFFNRLKREWIHFIEQNERDNLSTVSYACCVDPTERL